MTRKPPSGAKHSGCRTHVAHDYVRSGWLCVTTNTENIAWPESNYLETAATDDAPAVVRIPRDMQPVDRQADMVAFANHVAAVAMAHRSAELERLTIPTDPGNGTRPAYVGSPTHIGGPTITVDDSPKRAKRSRANVRAGILRPVQRADVVDLTAPDPERSPFALPDPVAPVDALAPESVEPETSSRRDDDGEPDADGTALAHDFGNPCHCIVCEPAESILPPEPHTFRGEPDDGCYYCGRAWEDHEPEEAPDAADWQPEPYQWLRPDIGTPTERAEVEAQYRAEQIAAHEHASEPVEPATAAQDEPGPVLATDGRPTCERCGQVFRKHGTGAEWHRVNRPDCAGARPALAIAS